MKPPRLLDQDSSGGVQGPGVGERHKAASKPLIQSGPKSAAGRSRATSKSLPMGYPYFDITNERAQPCQNALLEGHSGDYRKRSTIRCASGPSIRASFVAPGMPRVSRSADVKLRLATSLGRASHTTWALR